LNLGHVDDPRHLSPPPRRRKNWLRTRERRRDCPNFRDHGLTVDRSILHLLASLQRRHFYAWGSERRFREMIYDDTGHLPGVGTLRAALRRLELLGYLEVRWIWRGTETPDGGVAQRGCLRVRLAVNRGDRRAIVKRAEHIDRRAGVSGRVTRIVPSTFAGVVREMGRGAPDERTEADQLRDLRASQGRGTAALAAWAKANGLDDT